MLKTFHKVEKNIRYNQLKKHLKHVNRAENRLQEKPDSYFPERTLELIHYISERKFNIDVILPEAFALVREATKRTIGIRQFDVQVLGGASLYNGHLTEMKTGEGKTYVTLFPIFLNALMGERTHVITANKYLAKRDYETISTVLNFLGISSALLSNSENKEQKQKAYQKAVCFGTIFEFVFDYLNNNLVKLPQSKMELFFDNIILDEADYILIDEARRPVNITGNVTSDIEMYKLFNEMALEFEGKKLSDEQNPEDFQDYDFLINPKNSSIELTNKGHYKLEKTLIEKELISENSSIYISENLKFLSFMNNALKANFVLKKDIDYIFDSQDETIVLIDENSGRPEKGSRWGEGLHQAVEAKENVEIQAESNVKATITIQNFLKLYKKVSGMTGTALDDEDEFKENYGLNVCVIPTNKPNIRQDYNDILFEKKSYCYQMVFEDVKSKIEKSRPVLIGVSDVTAAENLSSFLSEKEIPHNILSAKHHEKEASVIAQAGKPSVVTIATSMAGRGTDIILGGNETLEVENLVSMGYSKEQAQDQWKQQNKKVVDAGGLHIIGLGRNDSRRIDNQLIGRAGRQGDPGSTIFYLSLEDKLLQVFGDPIKAFWKGMNVGETGLTHSIIDKTIYNGQKKIEGSFFNQRKYLLRYDSINAEQREIIYHLRDNILKGNDLNGLIASYINFSCKTIVDEFDDSNNLEKTISNKRFSHVLKQLFNFDYDLKEFCNDKKVDDIQDLIYALDNFIFEQYIEKMKMLDDESRKIVDYYTLLETIDSLWEQHLSFLSSLRKNSDLSVNAQQDPVITYKKDSLEYFKRLIEQIKIDYTTTLCYFNPVEKIAQIEEEANKSKSTIGNEQDAKQNKHQLPVMFLDSIGV